MMPKMEVANRNRVLIGRRQPCRHCTKTIRVLYLIARDRYWLVDDFDANVDDPMVTHECEGDSR